MKKTIKNTLYSGLWIWLALQNSITNALDPFAQKTTTTGENWQKGDFVWTLDLMLWYVIWLLYFIAVVIGLYGAFQILTAGWDEEKVKKWRKTLINAVIWLALIFLVSIIIRWIIALFNWGTINQNAI